MRQLSPTLWGPGIDLGSSSCWQVLLAAELLRTLPVSQMTCALLWPCPLGDYSLGLVPWVVAVEKMCVGTGLWSPVTDLGGLTLIP